MTYAEAVAQLKSVLTPTSALEWIKARYGDFRALGPKLVDLMHQASQLAVRARAAGDTATADRLKQRIYDIGGLATLHQNTMNQIDRLLAVVGLDSSALGALPVLPVVAFGTALAVAATMLYLTFHVSEQQKALDLEARVVAAVEAGRMTPAQGQAFIDSATKTAASSSGSGFGSQISKAALGVGALVLLWFGAPYLFPRRR